MSEVEKPEKLVFVYDVDSSPENKIALFFKRNLMPSKIECPLYRLVNNSLGIKPEVTEYLKKLGLSYEMLYRNEFIKKYENYEIFGKFKMNEAAYPSVFIIVGGEKEEREIYELVAARYFMKCEMVSCFGKVLERKYNQFKELGPEEFKKANSQSFQTEDEIDEEEEKKQKIENVHKKIADMEDEIKRKQEE
jgi:hypothetical protein